MGLKCDKRHNEEYSFLSQVTYLLTFSNWKGAASELHKLPIFFGPFQKQKSTQMHNVRDNKQHILREEKRSGMEIP